MFKNSDSKIIHDKFSARTKSDISIILRDLGNELADYGNMESAYHAMQVASKLKPGSYLLRKRANRLQGELEKKQVPTELQQKLLSSSDEASSNNHEPAYKKSKRFMQDSWLRYQSTVTEKKLCKESILSKIEEAYLTKSRLSVVRSGDGEGCFLYRWSGEFDQELFLLCARATLEMHFGPQHYANNDCLFWANEIYSAFNSSEVITSARSPQAVTNLLAIEDVSDYRAMIGQIAGSLMPYVIAGSTGADVYEHGHLHRDLIPNYAGLLRGKSVVLIGPNGSEFSSRFSRTYECEVSDIVTIPGQFIVEKERLNKPLYPELYQETLSEIHDLEVRGKLCLVGAGLAGKIFCAKIADKGGIALDVGSMMDAWAGKKARKYHDGQFLSRVSLNL